MKWADRWFSRWPGRKSGRARDVLLTGLPRSGTTLTCYLLNLVPDTVALHEPMNTKTFSESADRNEVIHQIRAFFEETRDTLRRHGRARSKHIHGSVPSNTFGEARTAEGWRNKVGMKVAEIEVAKPLSRNFLLCVKHPAAFTAVLEVLVKAFSCFAVIRNPLSVLGSWNSLEHYLRQGHNPAAERLDAGLAGDLAGLPDAHDRQLRLLAWYYGRYRDILPADRIIRYEEMVASGGRSLAAITPRANALHEALESKNKNELYDAGLMRSLGRKLLDTEGPWWEFYTRESVERLL